MSTDLSTYTAGVGLAEQTEFARLVANAGVLPKAYRGNPGSVLVAVGLGASMGLSPAESLYRIHVVEGKPSASAELIAANVRRAGHRLRITATNEKATAQIVRSDDPDFVYETTWTLDDARRAGLATKDNWKKHPRAMLRARAITEAAREACPEALYGVVYATEELEHTPRTAAEAPQTVAAPRQALQAAIAATVVEEAATAPQDTPAEVVDAEPDDGPQQPITDRTRKHLFALLNDAGITDPDQQRAGMSAVLGREVTSRSTLTEDEGRALIIELEARADH